MFLALSIHLYLQTRSFSIQISLSVCPSQWLCSDLATLTRTLDNFPKIQREVQEALLAIHEAEGDETDAAPEQVDCARSIQNLSKEILGRLAVGPAENLEDEDNETLEPYELFRSSWDVCGATPVGSFSRFP